MGIKMFVLFLDDYKKISIDKMRPNFVTNFKSLENPIFNYYYSKQFTLEGYICRLCRFCDLIYNWNSWEILHKKILKKHAIKVKSL